MISRRGEAPLKVKVVKGCPLIPTDQGLRLLQEYEAVKEQGTLPSLQVVRNHQVMPLEGEDMRVWLARKVGKGFLTKNDQAR